MWVHRICTEKICTVFSSTEFYYSTPECRNVRGAAFPFHMLGCACLHPFRAGTPWNTETFASPSVTGGEAAQGGSAKAKDSTST